MKLDEGKIVSTAKYYIDEFCSFMYFSEDFTIENATELCEELS